jgi:3-deoxy-manno-octulosonate cytidylyltransferase (CMP-KDO synthetase)
MSFRVVIPARFASTRLPGKPLRPLAGRPLVVHAWDRASAAGAREVVVACDDQRIARAIEASGGRALMTAPDHSSGTDRIAEVARALGWADGDVVVNLQGDEPLMDPEAIRQCAEALERERAAGIATLATPIRTPAELFDPGVVKVVLDDRGLARYFSRAPIPWVRDAFAAGPPAALPAGVPFLRHIGLYAYRVAVLERLTREAVRPYEAAESLEQLRAIALGIPISVRTLDNAPAHGVDTEADLARVEALLQARADPP